MAVLWDRPIHVDELTTAAQTLLNVAPIKTWIIHGKMGAGKTTLIKALCKSMGVVSLVNSPTFSIVNEYVTRQGEKVFHFDFYRLKSSSEALDIGVEEYLDSGHYCFIEWGERIEALLPARNITVQIKLASADTRYIEYNVNE